MIYFILVIYVTKVYIVRHCETDGNALRIFQGHTNNDINEMGAKQLLALGDKFKNIPLNAVYSSPLIRAHKTALAISESRNTPLFTNDGLVEINGGVYEGKTFPELKNSYPEFAEMWESKTWEFAPENGETMPEAYDRIWDTVTKIVKENKDKTIAIVSHGFVIRSLFCRILYNDIKKFRQLDYGFNTSVSLLEFEDETTPKIVYLNDLSHLTDELINKNARVPIK